MLKSRWANLESVLYLNAGEEKGRGEMYTQLKIHVSRKRRLRGNVCISNAKRTNPFCFLLQMTLDKLSCLL